MAGKVQIKPRQKPAFRQHLGAASGYVSRQFAEHFIHILVRTFYRCELCCDKFEIWPALLRMLWAGLRDV